MNVTITPQAPGGDRHPAPQQVHRPPGPHRRRPGGGGEPPFQPGPVPDIQATRDCLAALKHGRPAGADGLPRLDCGESGSTLRFLIPVALTPAGGRPFHRPGAAFGAAPGPLFHPL